MQEQTENAVHKRYSNSQEEFEDTQGGIRVRKSMKDRQHNDQKKKKTKGQTRIYQISHIKLNNISGDRDLLHINPTTMRYHDEIYLKIGYHTDI